jgi:hypothetical protein
LPGDGAEGHFENRSLLALETDPASTIDRSTHDRIELSGGPKSGLSGPGKQVMPPSINFSQLLRPVGQMLEPVKLESFTLKIDDVSVYVSGRKQEESKPPPVRDVSLRVVWQALRRKRTEPAAELQPSSGIIELRYTPEDIERMDAQGKSNRMGGSGTPEAHTLSQLLRAVGGYVDQKGGRLLEIKKINDEITVEYESALRKKLTETFTVAGLYDYWVKMYLRRKKS